MRPEVERQHDCIGIEEQPRREWQTAQLKLPYLIPGESQQHRSPEDYVHHWTCQNDKKEFEPEPSRFHGRDNGQSSKRECPELKFHLAQMSLNKGFPHTNDYRKHTPSHQPRDSDMTQFVRQNG